MSFLRLSLTLLWESSARRIKKSENENSSKNVDCIRISFEENYFCFLDCIEY